VGVVVAMGRLAEDQVPQAVQVVVQVTVAEHLRAPCLLEERVLLVKDLMAVAEFTNYLTTGLAAAVVLAALVKTERRQ
jgi:hypothetical protein